MKKNLGAILTAIDPSGDEALQMANVDQLLVGPAAGMVFVHSKTPFQEKIGLRVIPYKAKEPTLKSMIADHALRFRGRETIGIFAPGISVKHDLSDLWTLANDSTPEMVWAFHANPTIKVGPPEFFIITTSIMPHILRELPETVRFVGTEWAVWLHDWLTKRMQRHRYMDATRFGVVATILPPPAMISVQELAQIIEKGQELATAPKPKKAKKKRAKS